MNMKTMFAGRQSLEIGRKFQSFVGFSDFHCPDGLTYALRGDEIHFYFIAGCLRPCANNQRDQCQSKTLHMTSAGYFLPLKCIPEAKISPESHIFTGLRNVVAERSFADAEPLLTAHLQLFSRQGRTDAFNFTGTNNR